jgi:predicted acetylornithine/succinylornithine family transaminase
MTPIPHQEDPFFDTYRRLPLEIERGDGVYLYTKDGARYLDMFAGIAVNALGHGHPGILRAIEEQARRYLHVSNFFLADTQAELARLLLRHSGFSKVFFTNSGTEATEGAIKIARRYGSTRGKTEIIGFSNSFHGRTMGSLSLMDRRKHRDGYGPFLGNCRVITFNDVPSLRNAVSRETAAIVFELIQGESGVHPATREFLEELDSLQKAFGVLLIVDEIQTGMGRTGRLLAVEHSSLRPDVVLLAKALGGGLPLGAILGNEAVAGVFEPGSHGSTFGGNPLSCAAGIVVLKELIEGGVMENVNRMGSLLSEGLGKLHRAFPALVAEVRGSGLMLGVELHGNGQRVAEELQKRGILVNVTEGSVLRIVPPLTIGKDQVEEFLDGFEDALNNLETGSG